MPRKRFTPEEIIKLLRLVEIEVAKGRTAGDGASTKRVAPPRIGMRICSGRSPRDAGDWQDR